MGDVTDIGISSQPVGPNDMLKAAMGEELATVLIIGQHGDGSLFISSNTSDIGEHFLVMARANKMLLNMIDGAIDYD